MVQPRLKKGNSCPITRDKLITKAPSQPRVFTAEELHGEAQDEALERVIATINI